MIQIILSGDVHPQPGPNSKQKQNSRPGQDPEENHSTASVVSQHATSCIKIAHLNIRSLKSREHRFLLQHTIEDHNFDIFTISETWLDSTVDNQAVQIPGFVFFRQDRGEHKSGGGLAVYIRDTFKATILEHASGISDENFQQLWIKVQVRHCKSIFICTVYRPPGTTLAFSDSLSRTLLDMLLHGNDIIILGDLNCNILDDRVDSRTFKELCASFNLTQLVKEPTRITETKRSLIDVIMATDPTLAESCSVITSSISDHNLVEVTLKISRPKVKSKYVTTRSYSEYAPDSFCEDLSLVPWHLVYFFDDTDSQVETFNSLFLDVLDQHAPIKRIKIKSHSHPFVTPEIKQLMKTKDRWHRKAIQTNDKLCWNGYRFFRQEVKRELRLAEKIHVRNEIANSRRNTNATWKTLNRCMSRGTAKRPSTLEDQETLANKFNKYFTSVGELTAYKANLISREYGLDEECGSKAGKH